jgi:DNA polymerase III delta subunit
MIQEVTSMGTTAVAALERGARVVYLHGDAKVLVDATCQAVERWGLDRCGLPAFNHARAHAEDSGALAALDAARTLPMMADLRVVTIVDVHRGAETFYEGLLAYLEDVNESTLLILTGGSFGKVQKGEKSWGVKLLNAIKKVGFVEKFEASGVDRVSYVVGCARRAGRDLSAHDARLLIELVGTDLGTLEAEVAKLLTYAGADPIDAACIREACSALAEEEVWELTSGLTDRDPEMATRALHRLLKDAKEPHYLLAMVVMQVRKIVQAEQLIARGLSDPDIARSLRIRQQEVQGLRRRVAHAKAPAYLMERLAGANRDMNSLRVGGDKTLEGLVLDLCSR